MNAINNEYIHQINSTIHISSQKVLLKYIYNYFKSSWDNENKSSFKFQDELNSLINIIKFNELNKVKDILDEKIYILNAEDRGQSVQKSFLKILQKESKVFSKELFKDTNQSLDTIYNMFSKFIENQSKKAKEVNLEITSISQDDIKLLFNDIEENFEISIQKINHLLNDILSQLLLSSCNDVNFFLSSYFEVIAQDDSVIVTNNNNIEDNIIFKIFDVDDATRVWHVSQPSKKKALEWTEITELRTLWEHGKHGEAQNTISHYLHEGENYIVFSLYNLVFNGGAFFKGGKWSYGLDIIKNQKVLWTGHTYKSDHEEIGEKTNDLLSSNNHSISEDILFKNIKKFFNIFSSKTFKNSSYFGKRQPSEIDIIEGLKYWKVFKFTVKKKKVKFSEIIHQDIHQEIQEKLYNENINIRKRLNKYAKGSL